MTDIEKIENISNKTEILFKNNNKDISSLKNILENDFRFVEYLSIKEKSIQNYYAINENNKIVALRLYVGRSGKEYENLLPSNELPIDLLDFTELQCLTLGNIKIKNLGIIRQFSNLKYLRLINVGLTDLSIIESFEDLELLDVSNNNISNISQIKNKIKLKVLNLSVNNISDISLLKELHQLKVVSVANNPIKKIDTWILDTNFELGFYSELKYECFNLPDTIESPPVEIIKQGKDAIKAWFNAVKGLLTEVKILLVGDPKAGKTSLLRRLKNDNSFNELEQQTDGIIIEDFEFNKIIPFKNNSKLRNIKATFWDFGGQEIMTSTHRFFMTKRSLYILVLDARKDVDKDQFIYNWLKRIETYGGNSSVLIVINQIDVNPAFSLNQIHLQKDFPQIKGIIRLSCKTGENIQILRNQLEEIIPKIDLLQTQIDERWLLIKNELQVLTKQKNKLSEKIFEDICCEFKLIDIKEQHSLINFLNDLGIVLHFDKLNLSEFFVLDPLWITTGVYRIITSHTVIKKEGIIDIEELKYIINHEKRNSQQYFSEQQKGIKYSSGEVFFIANIMNQFKLCYFIDNGTKMLIPDLLTNTPPLNEFDYFTNNEEKITLIYDYDFLNTLLIPRLIVELNKDIEKLWRTGLVLNYNLQNRAKAFIYSHSNLVIIKVIGEHKQKRDYLSIIRFFIDKINSDFNLNPKIKIPLSDDYKRCIKYSELLQREQDGEKIYKDYETNNVFEICKLLEGIASKEEIQEQAKIVNNYIYIYGNNNNVNQK